MLAVLSDMDRHEISSQDARPAPQPMSFVFLAEWAGVTNVTALSLAGKP